MENKANDKPRQKSTEKNPENGKPKKKSSSNEEFKRRYFDYYDDVKISDRQDW